jgi:hypothetical protein
MTVTAVVCSFWENRVRNVQAVVDSIRAGSVQPDHLLVLNNNPEVERLEIDGADTVIQTGFNYECRGKFIAGLMKYADYYLLADDDTALGPKTLETLLSFAPGLGGPEFVTGYWGVQIRGRSFMKGTIVQPHLLKAPVKVDAFHGRVMFMGHMAMVRMLELESGVREKWPVEGDDLIAGVANPSSSWAVPLAGDAAFIDLPEHGQAMQYAEGYFAMRDEFCGDVLDASAEMGWRRG